VVGVQQQEVVEVLAVVEVVAVEPQAVEERVVGAVEGAEAAVEVEEVEDVVVVAAAVVDLFVV
jgi:hypothetical protein